MTITERCSAITGCKLYLMDLTSTFTALVPRDEGDTEEMTHTNTQAWKDLEAHIFIQRTRWTPPPCYTYTWRSCLCSKFNYPLIDTSQGYLRCRHELWFPRGATGSSLCPNRERPTPPPPPMHFRLADTHTHIHTPKQTHLHLPTPAPAYACSRGVLINRQSVKNHSLKSLKGFTPALWLAGKENPMNS